MQVEFDQFTTMVLHANYIVLAKRFRFEILSYWLNKQKFMLR